MHAAGVHIFCNFTCARVGSGVMFVAKWADTPCAKMDRGAPIRRGRRKSFVRRYKNIEHGLGCDRTSNFSIYANNALFLQFLEWLTFCKASVWRHYRFCLIIFWVSFSHTDAWCVWRAPFHWLSRCPPQVRYTPPCEQNNDWALSTLCQDTNRISRKNSVFRFFFRKF